MTLEARLKHVEEQIITLAESYRKAVSERDSLQKEVATLTQKCSILREQVAAYELQLQQIEKPNDEQGRFDETRQLIRTELEKTIDEVNQIISELTAANKRHG